jgi:murein DD-endopeptidase MepM/ murein hydrolase activator NlpD
VFRWPIEPKLGISAYFHDASYEERMGLIHEAIDIPTEDRSTAHAPADGTVATVADNGMGYSYLVIEHDGGFATVYGHVSYFYVQEGDEVRAGQIVALTGGVPGERGAGRISTGPHLHFEVHKDGAPVDPLPYLPEQP